MTNRNAGVWIDHRKALMVLVTPAGEHASAKPIRRIYRAQGLADWGERLLHPLTGKTPMNDRRISAVKVPVSSPGAAAPAGLLDRPRRARAR